MLLLTLVCTQMTVSAQQEPISGPSDLPGLILYLRADQDVYQSGTRTSLGPAAVASGDPVGLWLDQSGNMNDAILPATAAAPTLASAAFYGYDGINMTLPAVRFGGPPTQRGQLGQGLVTPCDPGKTFTVVAVYASQASGPQIPLALVGGSNRWLLGPYNNAYQAGVGGGFAKNPITTQQGTVVIQTVTQYGTNLHNYLMGVQTGSLTNSARVTPGPLHLGAIDAKSLSAGSDLVLLLVYNRVLSTTEQTALSDWLAGRTDQLMTVVYAGNSLTFGKGASSGQLADPPTPTGALLPTAGGAGTTYPDDAAKGLAAWGVDGLQFDYGKTGAQGSELAAATVAPVDMVLWPILTHAPGRLQVAVFWEGTNDLALKTNGPASASVARAYNGIAQWCSRRHLRGIVTITLTIIPRTGTSGVDGATTLPQSDANFEADRQAVNAELRKAFPTPVKGLTDVYTGASYGDYLVDVAADPLIGSLDKHGHVNVKYYSDAHTHLNDAGYQIIAGYVEPLLQKIIASH
jgi:lysophospholipase L1-like esterase